MAISPPTLLLSAVLALLPGCTMFGYPYQPNPQPLEAGRLPRPDVAVRVAQLRPCTDSPDATLELDSTRPVTVLVHGCNGSAGNFRSLAQLYAFHGQQTVCFTYSDRLSLVTVARQLGGALDALAGLTQNRDFTVIGHSMGGLIARKAMEDEQRQGGRDDVRLSLATVSAPLAGIRVATRCASKPLQWLSLGVVPGLCWIVSGESWLEITAPSDFIQRPRPLAGNVRRYVKVVTDERDTCRRTGPDGRCIESDFIFTLAEQYQPLVDRYPQLRNIEVAAGHVEIVGYKDVAPRKLIDILQKEGLLAATPPHLEAAFSRLLAELY